MKVHKPTDIVIGGSFRMMPIYGLAYKSPTQTIYEWPLRLFMNDCYERPLQTTIMNDQYKRPLRLFFIPTVVPYIC